MDEKRIQDLFSLVEEKRVGFERSKELLQEIIKDIENMGQCSQNEKLQKIYALSLGKLFMDNGLTPWDMAKKSIHISELYLSKHPTDYEVNSSYLTVTEMIFEYEKSFHKALELYQSQDRELKKLAVQYLSHLTFYHEGFISKSESERYYSEYQACLKNNNY